MSRINYKLLKNKYVITLVIFTVWVLFFDKSNVKNWLSESGKNSRMEREKKYYEDEIIKIDNQLTLLRSNNESFQKFAREEFYMKRDNEEIFIIEE